MRQVLLRGGEHHDLSEIALHAEAEAAVAISMGGHKKVYSHTDPNEDAALLVRGEGGLLLAVADGHHGHEAAEVALERLAAHAATWTAFAVRDLRWPGSALEALADANHAILAHPRRARQRSPRTTLSLALVRPDDGLIRHASMGDSHVYHATAEGVLDLTAATSPVAPHTFLGHGEESLDSLAAKCRSGEEPLAGTHALVVVTDGLTERGVGVEEPEDVVAELVAAAAAAPQAMRGETLARGVLEAALAAHRERRSGDNVAASVAWLAPPDRVAAPPAQGAP